MNASIRTVDFGEALRTWLKIGCLGFGGPAGQIALMHHELVERRRWIGERRFLHALSYCTLLPGPEAQQLAIYIGWLLHRTIGGVVAGLAFILPAFVLIMGLAWAYAAHGDVNFTLGAVNAEAIAVARVVRGGEVERPFGFKLAPARLRHHGGDHFMNDGGARNGGKLQLA